MFQSKYNIFGQDDSFGNMANKLLAIFTIHEYKYPWIEV